MIAGTAAAWVEAVTGGRKFEEARDRPRFRAAFVSLAQTREQWPAPRHFLDALPRVEQAAIAYEVKPVSAEEAAANIARLKGLLAGFADPVPLAKVERETTPESRERIEAELRQHYDRKTAAAGGDA